MSLAAEALAFRNAKDQDRRRAAQLAALFLGCGIDLEDALASVGEARATLVKRVERLLVRERLRGLRKHWSYDLNRHIALKQVRDQLRCGQIE